MTPATLPSPDFNIHRDIPRFRAECLNANWYLRLADAA